MTDAQFKATYGGYSGTRAEAIALAIQIAHQTNLNVAAVQIMKRPFNRYTVMLNQDILASIPLGNFRIVNHLP